MAAKSTESAPCDPATGRIHGVSIKWWATKQLDGNGYLRHRMGDPGLTAARQPRGSTSRPASRTHECSVRHGTAMEKSSRPICCMEASSKLPPCKCDRLLRAFHHRHAKHARLQSCATGSGAAAAPWPSGQLGAGSSWHHAHCPAAATAVSTPLLALHVRTKHDRQLRSANTGDSPADCTGQMVWQHSVQQRGFACCTCDCQASDVFEGGRLHEHSLLFSCTSINFHVALHPFTPLTVRL
jgi:hypothetical protein